MGRIFSLLVPSTLVLGACLDTAAPPPGQADVAAFLQVRCLNAQPLDVTPITLWLASDTLEPDTLVLGFTSTIGRRQVSCALNPSPSMTDTGGARIAGLRRLDDSTFSVFLTGKSPGVRMVWVTFNAADILGEVVLIASRPFARAAWGHVGAGIRVPENTRLSIETAIRAGLPGSEVDVRLTRDTVPILMHDSTVDRTTLGVGLVANYTGAEITALDAGTRLSPQFAGERVPTLQSILDLASAYHQHVMLDVESQRIMSIDSWARFLVAMVQSAKAESLVTLLAASPTFLRSARQASPQIGLALIEPTYDSTERSFALQLGVNAIVFLRTDSLVRSDVIAGLESLQQAGIQVIASTTNRFSLADSILTLTPVRAILTDYPPYVYRLRSIVHLN